MNVLDLLREMGIEPRLAQRGGKRGAEYWSCCPKAGCSQEDGFHVWPEHAGKFAAWAHRQLLNNPEAWDGTRGRTASRASTGPARPGACRKRPGTKGGRSRSGCLGAS